MHICSFQKIRPVVNFEFIAACRCIKSQEYYAQYITNPITSPDLTLKNLFGNTAV